MRDYEMMALECVTLFIVTGLVLSVCTGCGAVPSPENRVCRTVIYDCDDSELGIDDDRLLRAMRAIGMDCDEVEVDAVVCLGDE
jgi:hypothetical protein